MARLIKAQPQGLLHSGFFCPSYIWHDKSVSLEEKAFLVEIERLHYNGQMDGKGSSHFQDFFGFSKPKTKKILRSLSFKGWISLDGEDA